MNRLVWSCYMVTHMLVIDCCGDWWEHSTLTKSSEFSKMEASWRILYITHIVKNLKRRLHWNYGVFERPQKGRLYLSHALGLDRRLYCTNIWLLLLTERFSSVYLRLPFINKQSHPNQFLSHFSNSIHCLMLTWLIFSSGELISLVLWMSAVVLLQIFILNIGRETLGETPISRTFTEKNGASVPKGRQLST